MSSNTGKPVIFLTFANATDQGYLQQLKKESALLRDLFLPLHQQGKIELLREESLETEELAKLLNQYKDRIALFHYGGHADGMGLSLEDGKGNANGLADLLGLQSGLKLVFLNGCSTQEQALPYLQAGVPLVLATTKSVSDGDATFFAEHFYHALINRHSVREAFQSASGALKTKSDRYESGKEIITSYRGVGRKKKALEELPWRLYVQKEQSTALDWKIQQAAPMSEATSTSKSKVWQFIIAIGVVIGILAGLAGVTGYDLRSLLSGEETARTAESMTVFVHGKGGKNDLILQNKGKVEITYGTKKARESINEKGQAVFNEIPAQFFAADTRVYINVFETDGEPYTALFPDSSYKLTPGEPVYLSVGLQGLEKVFGTTMSGESPLEGVIVSIGSLRDTTDMIGYFEFQIPEIMQQQEQEVRFFKPGFKLAIKKTYPQTKKALNVVMAKE